MNSATRIFAITAVTAAALAICVGTAHADPASASSADASQPRSITVEIAPGFRYHDNLATATTSLATPFGTVTVDAGRFDITDAVGHTVAGSPIGATSPNSTVVSAPGAPPSSEASAHANPADSTTSAAAPPGSPTGHDLWSDIGQSVEAANPHMGAALAFGTVVGSVVGAAVGCPFGIVTGGTLMALASLGTMTLPAAAAGCIGGAVAFGGLGAAVGGAGLAIPVGIAAGVQKYNQLQVQHAAEDAGNNVVAAATDAAR